MCSLALHVGYRGHITCRLLCTCPEVLFRSCFGKWMIYDPPLFSFPFLPSLYFFFLLQRITVFCLYSVKGRFGFFFIYYREYSRKYSNELHGRVLSIWYSLSSSRNSLFFHKIFSFVTLSARVRHRSLSWDWWIQFMLSPLISLISFLILFSRVWPGLTSSLLPSDFPTKTVYLYLISVVLGAPPFSSSFGDHPNNI